MNRVKIVEKEREGLEGEKLAAEAYLHKDAERLGTQSKIFQRFMSDGQVSCCSILNPRCVPVAATIAHALTDALLFIHKSSHCHSHSFNITNQACCYF